MTSDLVMAGSYNYGLVALCVLIAMLGSYATIDLAGRVRASHGGSRLSWRIGGATAMAIGTWAMHYTGMLAFLLPVPILYDWPTSLLSFLTSLLASAVALVVFIHPKMEFPRAFVASVFIGGGIAALHYTAMASMRFQGMHHYSPALVILSVLMAMAFALLSIWLTFLFRDGPLGWKLRKLGSVVLMGTAIWAMHYTGMASASFMKSDTAPDLSHAVRISALGAAGIGAVAFTVLTVALLTATFDRLQKGRVLLEDLFEQAPQAIALMSADYRVVRVNKEFTLIFGYGPKEAIGRHLREMIVPDDLQDEVQKFNDILASGQRVETEAVRRRKDGSRLYVSIVHVPVSLPGGEFARYAIFRDITERKLAEEALWEAQARIESILNSVADIHILIDRDWRYLYVNEAAVRAIGRPREQVLGRTLWKLYPDIVGTELGRQYHRAMDERIHVAFDFHYLTLDTWWENRFYPAPEGLSVFATNITKRKLAEEKLRATTEQLRALSARLQSAREEEATRIAREIHDELGGALTSLRWDLEDIDGLTSETGDRLDLQERRKKIVSMTRLIDTTINTVRRIASELRPIGLDDLGLVAAIELHARKFQDRTGIIVECDCTEQSFKLSQDQSTAIFRIFQEALTNILRHARATRVTIQTQEENEEFILTIIDNGRGITDEEKSGQLTLGLLGMRERAHLIGGRIEIIGHGGKGTVVIVRIPISGSEPDSRAS
jgi:PAS domain S-box-containing protein